MKKMKLRGRIMGMWTGYKYLSLYYKPLARGLMRLSGGVD
jgi:hypothetical protein